VGGDHGVQGAQIADGIFGFELEVSGQDLAGGVVLKPMRVRAGPRPSSQSWRLASVSAIMPKRGRGGRRERYWRGRRFCGEASLAARRMRRTVSRLTVRSFFGVKFFRQMRIVEALILAASQGQDQLLLGKGKAQGMGRPRLPCCTQFRESGR
jgi:hypothetical protein